MSRTMFPRQAVPAPAVPIKGSFGVIEFRRDSKYGWFDYDVAEDTIDENTEYILESTWLDGVDSTWISACGVVSTSFIPSATIIIERDGVRSSYRLVNADGFYAFVVNESSDGFFVVIYIVPDSRISIKYIAYDMYSHRLYRNQTRVVDNLIRCDGNIVCGNRINIFPLPSSPVGSPYIQDITIGETVYRNVLFRKLVGISRTNQISFTSSSIERVAVISQGAGIFMPIDYKLKMLYIGHIMGMCSGAQSMYCLDAFEYFYYWDKYTQPVTLIELPISAPDISTLYEFRTVNPL